MIISVFTLTIAYAVLGTTLNITGSAEISGSSWNITIDKLDLWNESSLLDEDFYFNGRKVSYNGIAYGDNGELIKEPTISGTTISDAQLSLVTPQDAVVLYYTVTNNGTIPAIVDTIVQNTPSFTSSTNDASDIEFISNNFISMISLYDTTTFLWENALDEGYVLCPGETIYFEFGAMIGDTATSVSSSKITISNLGGSINFVQADRSTCSNS